MSSTIAGKQTLGVASPRSNKKRSQNADHQERMQDYKGYAGYGGAASDNGAVISRIEKFEESNYGKHD